MAANRRSMPRGSPWFALLYDVFRAAVEPFGLGAMRVAVVRGVRGRVVEIGAGTGASLAWYSLEASVIATEPDEAMRARLQRRIRGARAAVVSVAAEAEALPFEAASFDHAVSALTLCTVRDPERALLEVRRVLRPGGQLHFLEHVRSEDERVSRVQDFLAPAWRRVAGGCHLNLRTLELLDAAGFEVAVADRRTAARLFPFVRGVAVVRP